MGEDHLGLLLHRLEDVVILVALLQVLVSSLVAATDKVDATVLGCDRSGVQWDFKVHLYESLFELRLMHFEYVCKLLVPLERMYSSWYSGSKAILDIVINS